jgi:hypothetical protein
VVPRKGLGYLFPETLILLGFRSARRAIVYRFSVPISSLIGSNYDLEPIVTEAGALDTVSPDQRSSNMAAIKGKNTRPELRVRPASSISAACVDKPNPVGEAICRRSQLGFGSREALRELNQ